MDAPASLAGAPDGARAARSSTTGAAAAATRRVAQVAAAHIRIEPSATYAALAALFGALADPTRARIVHLLMDREWSTSEIAALIGVSAPATSQHLRVLRGLRLVQSHRAGRWVYYRLDDAHVALLMRTSLEHLRDAGGAASPVPGETARKCEDR